VAGDGPPRPLCQLLLHEERRELADAELEVRLADARVRAFGEIYGLVRALWDIEAIDRMTHLGAQHDLDAARLELERAQVVLVRQRELIGQVERGCRTTPGTADPAYVRYRRADCEQDAKGIDVARTNLAFDRELLASVEDLRARDVATRQDVILARLEVTLEELRLADAERRTEACRREQAELEPEQAPVPDGGE
jgi:hypothetical protein